MQSKSDDNGGDETAQEAEMAWSSAADRLASSMLALDGNYQNLRGVETNLRTRSKKQNLLLLFIINGIATILIVLFYLISFESLLGITLCVTLTIYTFRQIQDETDFNGNTMNWTLLSFAIVIPMSSSISMAFTRREKALASIAALRSLLFSIYQGHASWDWGTSLPTGRTQSKVDWLKHSDEVLKDIMAMSHDLTRYLTMPSTSRARHRIMPHEKKQAHDGREFGDDLMNAVLTRVNRISLYCEILKLEGLPGNEAARLRQWEREVVLQIETLQVIKEYRTPQAMRSLCRLFSVLLPPYYAPFYAQMAVDLNSLEMAIAFSILTSFALTALFESLTQMEDPFLAEITLDGIDVPRELQQIQYKSLLSQRNAIFFSKASPSVNGLPSEHSNLDTSQNLRIFGDY
jgi:hypothetical protein